MRVQMIAAWKRLAMWSLMMMFLPVLGCMPGGDPGAIIEPPTLGTVVLEPQTIEWAKSIRECHFMAEGCTETIQNNTPPITEENELCPSFFHAAMNNNPVLLASVLEHTVEWVHASGDKAITELPLDGFPEELPQVFSELKKSANYIAVRRMWSNENPEGKQVAHYALTVVEIESGQVLWHRVEHKMYMQRMWVHEDGSLVFNKINQHVNKDQRHAAVYVDPEGNTFERIGFFAMGQRSDETQEGAGVVIPVNSLNASEVGWWTPQDNAFLSVAKDEQTWSPRLVAGHFLWLQQGKTAPWLMVARPGEEAAIQPISGLPNNEGLFITFVKDPRWLLINDGEKSWRVELQILNGQLGVSGKPVAINLELPEGLYHMVSCLGPNRSLDSQGRLLLFLRDESKANAYRFDPDAKTFEVIGESINNAMGGTVRSMVNTYQINKTATTQFFCLPMDIPIDPDAPPGPSHQVAQPDLGVTYTLETDPWNVPIIMHYTGMCFVETNFDAESGIAGRWVRDLHSGKETSISFLGNPVWLN